MALVTDKRDIALDLATGDLDVSQGKFLLSSGMAAVAQAALIRVRLAKGELFLNQQLGVRLIPVPGVVTEQEALLGQRFDREKFEAELRDVLESDPDVTQVLLLQVTQDRQTRRVTSKWQLRTAFGDTPIETLEH
jgi:hypothetical protein